MNRLPVKPLFFQPLNAHFMAAQNLFQNPFLKTVKKSCRKAVAMSTFTDARLEARQAESFFAAQYAFYHPFHMALLEAYTNWKSQSGVLKGATLSVSQLLKLMRNEKISAWELAVMNVYPKGDSDYLTIFPQRRKPFQRGAKQLRINAVKQLAISLAGREALAATLADVQEFYTQLLEASTSQQGHKGNTSAESREVSTVAADAMEAMFKILGACIQQFGKNVAVAAPLFDVASMGRHRQTLYIGKLKGGENHFVLEHGFYADDELTVSSKGKTKLGYFLAANAHAALNGHTVIMVDEDESKTISASAFGDLSLRFLHVVNTSPDAEGHFRLQIK